MMALTIIGLTECLSNYQRLIHALDRKIAEKKVFCIEQENQFIEPCDEQRDCIMAINSNLAARLDTHLFRWDEQTLHALGRMNKQL